MERHCSVYGLFSSEDETIRYIGRMSRIERSCMKVMEDTVAEAVCVPEEIRGKLPGDYGRSKGVAWYYSGGFALVQTVAAQARIVKWDSKA
jgi:hypothetical protein